jgi:hypothetical protein
MLLVLGERERERERERENVKKSHTTFVQKDYLSGLDQVYY